MEIDKNTSELEKKPWEPMRLSPLGKATEIIQGGGGKISVAADHGEHGRPRF